VGTVVWSRALYYPHDASPSSASISLAVTASDDLAVLRDQTLRVVAAAAGADVWTAPAGYGMVAASPARIFDVPWSALYAGP
jgi:hypothetical protein